MTGFNPYANGTSAESRLQLRLAGAERRLAVLERKGGGGGGGGAPFISSVTDSSTIDLGVSGTDLTASVLNDSLARIKQHPEARAVSERTMAAASLATATTITLDAAPSLGAGNGYIVIDPFTIEAEVRRVTAVAGAVLTIPALTYAHASGDKVLFVDGDRFPVTWWGAKGDEAQDDAPYIQAAIDAVAAGNPNQQGTVLLPASGKGPASNGNYYKCLSGLNQKGQVSLEGVGTEVRLFFSTDAGVGEYAIDQSTAGERPKIKNLKIEGPYQPGTHKPTIKVITGATVAGGTTTFTTSTTHGLTTGDRVLVVDVLMTAGTGVNGHHTVTATPTTTTFSVAVTTTSTTYSSGGLALDPGVNMDGINCKAGGIMEDVWVTGFFAGLVPRDKTRCSRVQSRGNFYGVYFSVIGQGDISWFDCVLDANRMASCAAVGTSGAKGIGSHFVNAHFGDCPYCFYMEPTDSAEAILVGGIMLGCAMEAYRNAVMWGDRKDGSLTAGSGMGIIDAAVWVGLGDGTSIGDDMATHGISERPTTWGYRCGVVQEWIVDSPQLFLQGSVYTNGLFDFASVQDMEVRATQATFDALGSKKLLRDDCGTDRMEFLARNHTVRVVRANAAIAVGDLLESVSDRVQPCTTGVPVGVAKTAAAGATEMVAVVEDASSVNVKTTIGSGAGNSSRLIPDAANAGKVKAAVAVSDADQIGVAVGNSNGTTIAARLGGFGKGGGGVVSSVTDSAHIDHTITGSALSSTILPTAEPQLGRLGINVAPQSPHGITSATGLTSNGVFLSDLGSYADQQSWFTARRYNTGGDVISTIYKNYHSEISAKQSGLIGSAQWVGVSSVLQDRFEVNQWTIASSSGITAGGTVTLAGGGTVSAVAGNAITVTAHGFQHAQPIVFAGTPPTPLAAGTTYYVRYLGPNSFEVSTTAGGAAIVLTNATTGATVTPDHGLAVDDRVAVHANSNSANNAAWLVAGAGNGTTTFTLKKLDGGAFNGGAGNNGMVQNAPIMHGFMTTVNPKVNRSILTQGPTNYDDIVGLTITNGSPNAWGKPFRACDGIWLSNEGDWTGRSSWITAFTCAANVDIAFNASGTIGNDNSLAAHGRPGGAAFDCSIADFAAGAHPMRLPHGGATGALGIVGQTTTLGTYKHLISLGSNVGTPHNDMLLSNDGQNISAWSGGVASAATNAGSRVFQLNGGGGGLPADRIPEFKIISSPSTTGPTDFSSRCQQNLYAYGQDGTTIHRLMIEQDGGPPWARIWTTSNQALNFGANNASSFRIDTNQDVVFGSGNTLTVAEVYGDSASGGSLTLNSTSHATKGFINFGTLSAYDGTNFRLGLGSSAPTARLTLATDTDAEGGIRFATSASPVEMARSGANDLRIGWSTNNSLTLNITGLMSSNTLVSANDVLYMSAHKTGFFDLGKTGTAGLFRIFNPTVTADFDAQPVRSITADGKDKWGPGGSTAVDHTLERLDANTMRFTNALQALYLRTSSSLVHRFANTSSMGTPPANGDVYDYVRNDKFIIAYRDGSATMHYNYFDMDAAADPVVWHYSTTEPS